MTWKDDIDRLNREDVVAAAELVRAEGSHDLPDGFRVVVVVTSPGGEFVGVSHDTTQIDAALIAAAPDLLDVAEAVLAAASIEMPPALLALAERAVARARPAASRGG